MRVSVSFVLVKTSVFELRVSVLLHDSLGTEGYNSLLPLAQLTILLNSQHPFDGSVHGILFHSCALNLLIVRYKFLHFNQRQFFQVFHSDVHSSASLHTFSLASFRLISHWNQLVQAHSVLESLHPFTHHALDNSRNSGAGTLRVTMEESCLKLDSQAGAGWLVPS